MNDNDVAALLLESAWLSARIASGGALAAAVAAIGFVHARAHAATGRPHARRSRRGGSGVRLAAMAAALVVTAAATWLGRGQVAAWFAPPVQAIVAATGALASLAGAMIAMWAAGTLGANFAVHASVRDDEKAALVTGGPFALVRHPLYAALGLMAAGTALSWGSLNGLAWALLAYPPTAAWRAALEEQALAAAWGAGWEAYAARTPRFIPRI